MVLFVNLNAYGAISDKEQCERLDRLPTISKKFYKKFKDVEATLILYDKSSFIFSNRSRLPCLSDATFDNLLRSYAKLKSMTDDYRTLEELAKKMPEKTFLFKYLGNLYRKNSLSTDKRYQQERAKFRLLALKNYHRYIEDGGKPNKSIKLFIKNRGLAKAKNRWFERFSIKKVPTGSYSAFYFNSNEPSRVIKKSNVAYPAVNYSHDKFPGHKLASEDFAAYWVGDFIFDEEVEKVLNLRVSWSEYRLIIDGYEVSKGNKSGAIVPYVFSKGKHRIEVEYLNNYGATDFTMTMYDKREYLETKAIKNNLPDDYILLYVGLYESDNFDNSLEVKLQEQYSKPVVLLLSSYGNIYWKIDASNNDLKTIFVASSSHGSVVNMKNQQTTSIHHLKNFRGENSLGIKCRCSSTYDIYCEGKSLTQFDAKISNIFNHKLDGYSTLYPKERFKNKTLLVPKVSLNKKGRKKILLDEKEADNIKNQCQLEKNIGIDDIF